ncbi:hypothetical protein [Sphingomonas sp.]|uniref:hypothetical protein n=1 Tax=Sphingomonas sp. TaxID=28214 RepID=UPI00286D511E|nr:hypothetical protein [Sphingomonas sp.]
MRTPTTQAGGLFLMLGIIGGTIWGMTTGRVMLGVLTGTGIGAALAVVLWLIDRHRDRAR